MPATFDGDNLLVTLPAATTVIDVQANLYSEWKKWALLDDNLRFEPAFRLVRSEDVVAGTLETGAYFFFRNDLGWRLRGPDEDITVNFIGNFIPQNTAVTATLPVPGRTIFFPGLQPITQRAIFETSGVPAKGAALANFTFVMIDETDHASPATGLTVTAEVSKDGGAFAAADNAPAEMSNGYYKIDLTAGDMNADLVTLRFSAPGADDAGATIVTAS